MNTKFQTLLVWSSLLLNLALGTLLAKLYQNNATKESRIKILQSQVIQLTNQHQRSNSLIKQFTAKLNMPSRASQALSPQPDSVEQSEKAKTQKSPEDP